MIHIKLAQLPAAVKGITCVDAEGDYNIFINSNLTREQQRDTYAHEMRHIKHDDLHNCDDIATAEARAKS